MQHQTKYQSKMKRLVSVLMAMKIAYLLIVVNMNDRVRSLTHPLNNYFKE